MSIIDKYLNRIKLSSSQKLDINFLSDLVKAHLNHIPFENLDIHLKKPILLNQDYLSHKLLDQKRGGYCFELNGLFQIFLQQLGYKTRLISAQVFNNTRGYSPEFDHAAILVTIDNDTFLVDVGFGDFTQIPLNINITDNQSDSHKEFNIQQSKDGFVVSEVNSQQTKQLYRFQQISRNLGDFEKRNQFHQQSPNSHFHKKRLITRVTDTGRITLTDNQLIIYNNGKKSEQIIISSEFEDYLFQHFKIKI